MANNDAPFGLRPSRKVGGAYFSGGESRFRVTTSDRRRILGLLLHRPDNE